MFNMLVSLVESLYALHIEIKLDRIDPFKSGEVS